MFPLAIDALEESDAYQLTFEFGKEKTVILEFTFGPQTRAPFELMVELMTVKVNCFEAVQPALLVTATL